MKKGTPSKKAPPTIEALATECMGCNLCGEKAGYLTWPLLGYFPPTAKILLIGQNPAEPKIHQELQEFRGIWKPNFDTTNPMDYLDWYSGWFRISSMCSELEAYLGAGWFDTGLFAITNAVRCRTKDNKTPNDIMRGNCKRYTTELVSRYRYIICMGSVARHQMGINSAPPPKIYSFLEEVRTVLCIGHYAWRPSTGDVQRREEKRVAKWFVNQVKEGAWEK